MKVLQETRKTEFQLIDKILIDGEHMLDNVVLRENTGQIATHIRQRQKRRAVVVQVIFYADGSYKTETLTTAEIVVHPPVSRVVVISFGRVAQIVVGN